MDEPLRRFIPGLGRDLAAVGVPIPHSTYPQLTPLETMVVLLEDRRFFRHRGIDWLAWIREIWMICTFRKHGGASTIDMQFVRTRTGYREPTLSRKVYEMALARLLQRRLSKLAILRGYLAIAYFGTRIVGVSAAAAKLFDKETFELSEDEAALIAAMLVYPRPRKPTASWQKNVERRASYGLRLFHRYGSRYNELSA
jgi:monofunctional glycosyltransferase